MAAEDIEGSRAHARGLAAVGLLDADQLAALLDGLDRCAAALADGSFRPGPELEDIHMAVETWLIEHVGPVGARLHTARSRNDQVATDVRLWLRARLRALREAVADLVGAFVERVSQDGGILLPGYTHLQRGQPILLGHHLLAHAWAFRRDAERLDDALRRLDACPLGAGAMAGTPHPIDRELTARLLGFREPVQNAMDAVSARDHELEAVAACAILAIHLSRVAEEWVIWSSSEFGFVRLGEHYATGSSIMPQKRNPDAAELVRGKTGRVVGALTGLLTLCKGLPLAYNRDLQEDRAQLFDAVETSLATTRISAAVLRTLSFRADRFESSLRGDFFLATELADYLVTRGLAFREAHHVAGRLVASLEAEGLDFRALNAARLAEAHPLLDEGALAWLDPRAAAERRRSLGGTASVEVARQVALLQAWRQGPSPGSSDPTPPIKARGEG
jgi:argininosuccinate lyase